MKKTFFMVIAIFLCVGLVSTVLAGSSGERGPEKEQKLIVWDWQVMENYMAGYEIINKMFMEKYPNVVVERKAIASGEFEKQLKPVLSSGEPPDIFQVQLGAQAAGYYEAGILHVAEIGEKLQIARAQMTHLIDKLVDLGIVERRMDTADRRMVNIVLTSKGRDILEERRSNIRNAIKETLSCLTDEELEDLFTSLRKLQDIFSKLG